MIRRKIYQCITNDWHLCGGLDAIVLELAQEIKKGYRIKSIEIKSPPFETEATLKEPNLFITLEGKQI